MADKSGSMDLGRPDVTVSDILLFAAEPYKATLQFGEATPFGTDRLLDYEATPFGEVKLAAEDPSLPVFRAGARAFPDQPGGGEAYYGVDAGPLHYDRAFTKFPGGTGVRDTVSGQLGNVGLSYEEARQRIERGREREKLPERRTLSAHYRKGPFGAMVGRTWTEKNLNPFGWSPPPMTTAEARWNKGPLSLSGMVAGQRGVPGLADYGGRGEYRMNDPFGLGGNLALGAGVRRGREQPDGPPPGVAGDFWARYGLNF